MFLHLKAVSMTGKERGVITQIDSLEQAFDLASYVVAKGATLLEVFLFEDNKRTDLPMAAFDGQSFWEPIQYLEQEWHRLLSQPEPRKEQKPVTIYPDLIEVTKNRTRSLERQILNQIQLINRFGALLTRSQTCSLQVPRWRKLGEHYQKQIDYYHNQTTNLQQQHRLLETRSRELLVLSLR